MAKEQKKARPETGFESVFGFRNDSGTSFLVMFVGRLFGDLSGSD